MTTLVLTEKSGVDLNGAEFRMKSEHLQGVDHEAVLAGWAKYKDLGLVTYQGQEYFAGLYRGPSIPDDFE